MSNFTLISDCDAYLTHDSAPGRQQHIRGWKHREAFKQHYQKYFGAFMQRQQQQMQMAGDVSPLCRVMPFMCFAIRLPDAGHAADGSTWCLASASASRSASPASRPPGGFSRHTHGSRPAILHAGSDAPASYVPATPFDAATILSTFTKPLRIT